MPPETDNLKLEEIFQEDQVDRDRVYESPDEVAKLRKRDAARRKTVSVMMELGEVKTKNDLYHTAVIFQHGESAQDFMNAHRLATMSGLLGHRTARWLVAASLDRYLMKIGRPQVYGTQFEYNPAQKEYQLKLPIDETVFLSFEKEMLGVPSANQRVKQLNAKLKK